jgi:hypothetical protein
MPLVPISALTSRRLAVRPAASGDVPGLLTINGDPD